jgi:hypothetical protein
MDNDVVMGEASQVSFAFTYQTTDATFDTPIILHFQALECYVREMGGIFPEELVFQHLDGDTQRLYFFSDLDSKEDWVAENIPV